MLDAVGAGYKGSSDLYIDANIQLALAAGRRVSIPPCLGLWTHRRASRHTQYWARATALAIASAVYVGSDLYSLAARAATGKRISVRFNLHAPCFLADT